MSEAPERTSTFGYFNAVAVAYSGSKDEDSYITDTLFKAAKEIQALETERDALREALAFYADPDTYCAVAVFADPPCGGFAYDVSDVDHPEYENAYGAKARTALQETK